MYPDGLIVVKFRMVDGAGGRPNDEYYQYNDIGNSPDDIEVAQKFRRVHGETAFNNQEKQEEQV